MTPAPAPAGSPIQTLEDLQGPAYMLALRATGDREAAEDVVQDAYLRAFRQMKAEGAPRELRSWFLVIVLNTARNALRSRARREHHERTAPTMRTQAAPPGEEVAAVRDALGQLEENHRLAISLCYEQGLTQREAAAVLGCPEGTLATHVNRGLARMREILERSGYAAAGPALVGILQAGTVESVPAALAGKLATLFAREAAGIGAAPGGAAVPAVKGGILMKIGLGVAAAGLVAGGAVLFAGPSTVRPQPSTPLAAPPPAAPEPKAPAPEPANVPEVVLDESSPDWVVESFVGNGAAGQQTFFDGPALQAGGIGQPGFVTVAPDGTAYFLSGAGVVKVTPAGVARLILNATGKVEGSVEEVAAGAPLWNPKDNALYLTGPNCIRRLYAKPDGTRWVEVVAGIPNKPGQQDGPAKTATIGGFGGFYCTDQGVIYFGDGGIRKLENGTVTTVTKAIQGFGAYDEDGDVFYVSRSKNIEAFDVKSGKLSVVEGMPAPKWRKEGYPKGSIENRFNANSDGPALTHASNNSDGMSLVWDRRHKALWLDGPDEERCRWLKDGWVKTVITRKQGGLVWVHVIGIDAKGQIYIMGASNPTGLWRARNVKEVKP